MSLLRSYDPEITTLQYMDATGHLQGQPTAAPLTRDWLLRAYTHMLLTRRFDQRAIDLQRTGRLGTYASCLGQEAIATGAALAMQAEDAFAPYYRDQAAQLLRGVRMSEILRYWGGDEAGNDFAHARHDLPNCVPIATQLVHAAGIAVAFKFRRQAQAVLSTCGDGATSRGDFYEAMNIAGAWQLPLVILINNNQWAISMPRQAQTHARTLAQKAVAAGLPCVQVDGNDVIAVHAAADEALCRARAGKGPALIEAVSYRLCDHTTADDMRRYSQPDERERAWQREPLRRLRQYLGSEYAWDDAADQALIATIDAEIESEVQCYLATPAPTAATMFDHLYAQLPEELVEQRRQAIDGRFRR